MEIPPHPSWLCIITFSSSSANMATAIAVVKGEEEATPGGLAGTTMMTTDHTHRHPGDIAQDHQGTYIWTIPQNSVWLLQSNLQIVIIAECIRVD